MTDKDKWSQPEWGTSEPPEIIDSSIGIMSAAMAILLGGIVLGFISAIWYMAGD